MRENNSPPAHLDDSSGPIKSPKQLLMTVLFSFLVPVIAIFGLVYFVTSGTRPSAGSDMQTSVAQRIQRIGLVEIRDANRVRKTGNEVYVAQCAVCHTTGVANSPKLTDVAAWAPRIKTGFDALWNSALKGKGAMGAQGGGNFDDIEIARAVVFMTASAGAKFAEPAMSNTPVAGAAAAAPAAAAVAPAAAQVAAAAPVAAPAAPAPAAAPAVVAAATPAAKAATLAAKPAAGVGEAVYKQACLACHAAGIANAPKFGDKAAWAPRIQTGIDAMTASVIKGKGAMPPKGGSAAPDAELRAAVEYMVNAAK